MIHPPNRKKSVKYVEEKPIGRQIIYCSTRKKYLQQDRKISPRMLKLQCHMIIGNIIYQKKIFYLCILLNF